MKDLTEGNIWKTFFLFGLPCVLAGVLSQAYSLIDTVIAGKFLGERGLAAIGATAPLITFVSSVFWGFTSGFAIFVAKLFGAKDYKKIKTSIGTAYLLTSLFCILFAVVLVALKDPVLDALNADASIREDAYIYFAVYMGGLFLIIASATGSYIMNALGMSRIPLLTSVISSVINVGGNILAVAVFNAGVMGLALSTVVSAVVSDVVYTVKLLRTFKEMGVKDVKFISLRSLEGSYAYSLPNMVQQTSMYLVGMLVSPMVNGLGAAASASYSVVSRVYDLNASVYQQSARSLSNYAAQCDGMKKYDGLKKGVFVGFIQGIVFLAPVLIVCVLFKREVSLIFFKDDVSEAAKNYTYLFSEAFLPFIVFNMICNLLHNLYRGVKAMRFLFAATFFAATVRYVLSLVLMPEYGIIGFYAAWAASWIAEAAFSFAIFLSGRWNPKVKAEKLAKKVA